MMLGCDYSHWKFLLIWTLSSVLCLALYRLKGHKIFLALPPAMSLAFSGLELYRYTLIADSVNMGSFFLFVLSLMHLTFAMLIDQRATDWQTKVASLLGLLTAGFAYFSDDIFVFAFFWMLSVIPSYLSFDGKKHRQARLVFVFHHALSFLCLGVAIYLIRNVVPDFSSMQSVGSLPINSQITVAGVLIVMASLIRQAMFPFHLWFKAAYKTKPFPLAIGLYSMNLGFLLFLRTGLPLFAREATELFPYAMACGVLSSLYFACMAFVQSRLLSTVFYVMLAQYATLYSGLETVSRYGKVGVVFQFLTLGCAFTGLIGCLYAIEWNVGSLKARRFHGLQEKNPVLAVIFLLFALCTCALPFSMGFAGEDLIFHSVVEHYPLVGIGLIIAAGLNGISLFQTVTYVFRGKRDDIIDATIYLSVWQKAALGMILLVLFGFGLFPSVLLNKILAFI